MNGFTEKGKAWRMPATSRRCASLLLLFLFLSIFGKSQNFKGIYKIDQLLSRIAHPDTTYVVNFWATWCKPCIEELPAFDSLGALYAKERIRVLLVCLDFSDELEKKVKPFLLKHTIKSECVLLDEVNGNNFINKISSDWTGAIPATLFKTGEKMGFVEKKLNFDELLTHLDKVHKK